jgi:FkbM family methyltransferase
MNVKGHLAAFINKRLCLKSLQTFYEHLYMLSLSGMNIGGATLGYDDSGEVNVMRLIRRSLSGEDAIVIFDVGAHQGHYAKNLRSEFGGKAYIYCFEPGLSLFRQLVASLGNDSSFFLHQMGLGDNNEESDLFTGSNNIPSMFESALQIVSIEVVSKEIVRTMRLDTFCQQNGIDRINFLKIDVEGYEYKVLTGASALLKDDKVDFIQFEFGQCSIASRTYFHDFHKLLGDKYRLYRILRKGLQLMEGYHPKQEIFVSSANYLAVRNGMSI